MHVCAHVPLYISLYFSLASTQPLQPSTPQPTTPPTPNCLGGTQHSTLQLKETFFPKCASFSAERNIFFKKCVSFRGNVEYVKYVQKPLSKNVFLSAEMLNILNMLNILGTYWPHSKRVCKSQKHSTYFRSGQDL